MARELALRMRLPPNPPPRWPLAEGVLSFPFYDTSRKPWVGLSIWGLATLFMFRLVLEFWPFGG